jgi:hypothetical protein
VLDLPNNAGKAEAVRRGMLAAFEQDTEAIGYWDADLATPLTVIPEFCEVLRADHRLQMVLGARVRLLGRRVRRRAVRHYLGRGFATCASLVLSAPVYDTQCGAKLFRASEELRACLSEPFCSKWIFDVELLARFLASPRREPSWSLEETAYEFPLPQWTDVGGSKVRPRDFLKAFFELSLIYWRYLRPGARPQRPHPRTLRLPETSSTVTEGTDQREEHVDRAADPAAQRDAAELPQLRRA